MSESFRSIIKREMKRQGLSKYALAKLVEGKIAARTVYAYLSNPSIKPDTADVLARALGMTLRRKGGK